MGIPKDTTVLSASLSATTMRTSFTLLVITALVASVAFAQEDGEWAELQTANAPPRQDHSGFQVGDVMYIFGGVDQNGDVSNRVFELDLVSQLNFGAPLNPAGTPPTALVTASGRRSR